MSKTDGAETTRVTEKGQTTIPKPLREKYGIEPGDPGTRLRARRLGVRHPQ